MTATQKTTRPPQPRRRPGATATAATARHHRATDTARPGRHTATDTIATATTATIMHGHVTHAIAQTKERTRAIPHDTQHVNRTNIRANRRSIEHMYQCCAYDKPPGRGVSPWSKSRGRWLSSADAECSLEHFWITRYLRGLHIFSGCNRFCTLHIVYNGLWIDVDDGRA